MENSAAYLARKGREIALIDRCLATSSGLEPPESAAQAVELKFKLAAALRAERSLESWAITETARPEVQRWRSGAYRFSFGYQRADLKVRGPAIYGGATGSNTGIREETVYTGSGMSAIAATITALVQLRGDLELIVPRDCYSETRELLDSLGARITIVPFVAWMRLGTPTTDRTRILLLDSCISAGFDDYRRGSPQGIDLVLFDTTCFWQTSSRIRLAVDWALRAGLPAVLVRSHAKLDSLGIEYGRLGSIVLLWRATVLANNWMRELVRATEASVRLYGVAAIPAHFPPFNGTDEYQRSSRARTAGIVRNTRRMARRLSTALGRAGIRQFQHGLFLALVPGGELQIKDVKRAAEDLCNTLLRQRLVVRHAGSFGFDFVAVEWFYDARSRRNVIRVTGADLPDPLIDRIADGIEAWWSRHRMSTAGRQTAPIAASQRASPS